MWDVIVLDGATKKTALKRHILSHRERLEDELHKSQKELHKSQKEVKRLTAEINELKKDELKKRSKLSYYESIMYK